MFAYLSKKIAIPNNTRINCISWNKEHGYIAIGGDEGLVKVLKLEQPNDGENKVVGATMQSNLCMNQTLEGHKAPVNVVTWNNSHHKLTTSDTDGVIIVWMLYKESWYEEMTNDRKKSTVKGMAWTSDGLKICIVYEDGAIIVGSVDGNRIWGKELKNTSLTGVQWSPDTRLLIFSLRNGEVHLYDNQGTFVMKINIQCVTLGPTRSFSVVGLCWFGNNPFTKSNRPSLVICYETGKLQIMRNENDDIPIIVDAGIQAVDCQWNHDGTIIAICGVKTSVVEKDMNLVKFYTANGTLIRTMKIPGREIAALAWEGRSLRVALAVDSFIYFANIRPDYMWCYFGKTIAYLNAEQHRDGSAIITFWDMLTNQTNQKFIDTPISMASSNGHCVIALQCANITSKDPNIVIETNSREKKFQLMICNSISTTVDSKFFDLPLEFVSMNSQYVIAASRDHFLLWQYHTPQGASALHTVKGRKDKRYHIDDTPSGVVEVINDLDKDGYEPPLNFLPTNDPICSLALSETILLVGRESGSVHEYSVPNIALRNRHTISNRPSKMAINCNSSRASIIDGTGLLTTIDLVDSRELSANSIKQGKIERKDVWAMCWAKDNPQLLAIMEKTRMYILRGADPEEPISCSGYICNFEDLEITGILLDDIVSNRDTPNKTTHILQLRVKSLRDTEELLSHVGIAEAKQFIEDNAHPRLWRLLAEASLKCLDLETAENAFVRCTNYPGIQLIKRLKTIQNEILQKAEVAAFFGNFDDAEKLYIDADRRDLAINLRQTLCDWFRTVQLYRMGPGISDQQMEQAWKEIGNHFAKMRTWESAKEYYDKAHDIEGLMNSLYFLEQFDELESCIAKLPEKTASLGKLGQMLASVGMCNQAVNAYLKQGDIKAAVDTCVNLKQWGTAVELAQKYKMPQVNTLLSQHAVQLLQEGRLFEAIELKRKAGRFMDAARLMIKLAEGEIKKNSDILSIKKIYVLAGLLLEDHFQAQAKLTGSTRTTFVANLLPEDAALMDQIWHSAKAYHFMLLAQRQLKTGLIHSAVITSLRLPEFDDVVNGEDIYCMLALSSCADRSFGACSKAFMKLESLDKINEQQRSAYEELAVNIFTQNEPHDLQMDRIDCYACDAMISTASTWCKNCGTHFVPCIASGKSIFRPTESWQCRKCHQCAYTEDMKLRKSCPLCFNSTHLIEETESL